ncbi:LuxR C-terminal-related transcriptional regulator [Streptomyces sp. MCA2]|uniref:ATP-binding protein n=1 Tax=Streptomyces sp. MCA2 TaxID=2944805 RepID=UPI002021D41B|nr:LuxR C-terminal-related transcriptional regulator [Streptomyces sp. MCA2]MCL7495248.1 LuxR C-terminal-related transcriptional regulator [Streptomyces sp. MCA2]
MTPVARPSVLEGVETLPVDVTSFVGRRQQVTDAKRLLATSRLLTLTGPGGVGKTRLALHVAAAMRRSFRDGVRSIELAELRDSSLFAHTVAAQLGLHDQPSCTTIDMVIEYLSSREVLLILDNCEHLIDDCALFIDGVIRACPQVQILATSRQSLGVYGETTLVVPPLPVPSPEAVPSPDALTQYDSVKLFVDRAGAVLPGFNLRSQDCAAIARLCRALDGIPLAIELATVWLRALSLRQIEERLSERYRLLTVGPRNAPTRQRTLQALIDWSYDLCAQPEQQLWARASAFSGSFDLDGIEYVGAGEGIASEEIRNIVLSLVDKSILIRDEREGCVRYRMLETIREYGEARLVAAGEDVAIRCRHRDWYVRMVEQFQAEWMGPDQDSWILRLRREHANLREALGFCLTRPADAVVALRMADKLGTYLGVQGFNSLTRHWLGQALAASSEPSPERTSALRRNAWVALLQGDVDAAQAQLVEAAELARRLGLTKESAYVTLVEGVKAASTGDIEKAALLTADAMSGFSSGDELSGKLLAMSLHGFLLGYKGQRERGLALLEEALALTVRRGEVIWRSWALLSLSFVELDHDLANAEAAAREALNLRRRVSAKFLMAFAFEILAWVSERQARHVRAATLSGAAAAMWRTVGTSPDYFHPVGVVHHQHIGMVRAAMGDDRYHTAFQRGCDLSEQAAVDYALGTVTSTGEQRQASGEDADLTPREGQIAKLVSEGLTSKEIATRLVIAPRTAEGHVQRILTKLGFSSRAQIAAWYVSGQNVREPSIPSN